MRYVRPVLHESFYVVIGVAFSIAASLAAAAIDPEIALTAAIVAPILFALVRAMTYQCKGNASLFRKTVCQLCQGFGLICLLLCELTVGLFAASAGIPPTVWAIATGCGVLSIVLSCAADACDKVNN